MTVPEWIARMTSADSAAADTPDAEVDAARRLCEGVFSGLSRWVGADGSRALFMRALYQARVEHPSLENIQLSVRPESCLEGVADARQSHGAAATVAALESVVTALVSLLGRLIGDDMALKLISRASQERGRNAEHSATGDNSR